MAEQQQLSGEEGKVDAPVLPVSSGGAEIEPGVNIKVDEAWQISCMPEEKQYFSQDVSFPLLCSAAHVHGHNVIKL